jgi:hypothetical protein
MSVRRDSSRPFAVGATATAISAACLAAALAAAPVHARPADAPGHRDCACGGARVQEAGAPSAQVVGPNGPRVPATVTPAQRDAIAANADFGWDEAAAGAGGTLVVVLVAAGGVFLVRRRGELRPPLSAGPRPSQPAAATPRRAT